ncbi:MAG: hypothetical protein A3C70_03365 [Candidatus Zambryskibacteria bacterium RIFCSPHIGHO2_02_FULL_43_14]|uniref:VWFA domain-containing protein n=1 Tax=Candidatus Zambryskibacteria bacterium RIFCSPHIGHO2_02_FULL_43_14 TaxID=1802748 RepID=A0A1G2TGD4_9BACT|nr:MAG: hypothetical protein A2829_02590 [Candidatus Zambryskibacteria bacterium RIFCSPHIGHO2_01_FULL_43_60]OHA96283.1 MAG: hypothetical protein A3C70_03365 [Candidatus Zambryskibacteria bacterium RIFCSPHIGHO2_02_FULL_43_14]OHB04157.1 MAG: hypothetical protein A3B03_00045 [Candidatus Zambryskibacteria bacterium RIFCSPLOWO2_01_FULL_42_41]
MNEWSRRRKRIILSLIIFVLVFIIGIPLFFLLYHAPTCSDLKKNGNETGVDCGGSCQLLCTAESLPLISKGDPRVFKVRENTFEIIALVENPNTSGEIYRAGYTFKLYDALSTIPFAIIEGETYVPKSTIFAIFEGPFKFEGGTIPTRVTLEWKTESFVWQKNILQVPELKVKESRFSREDTRPRLDVRIENLSLENVSNIDLVAVISDETGNIFTASKTFIDTISAGKSISAVFTWPEPFKKTEKEETCNFPVDVALVIDRSGSMDDLGTTPPQPLTDVKNNALYFVGQLGKNDRHALISFANEASQPVDAMLGVDLGTIERTINSISIATSSAQNTNIGAGILAAREELNSTRHREGADKALVLLTDGVPTLPERIGINDYPKTYALESAELIRKDNISIYTIGLGKDVDIDFLKALATTTAEAYFVPSTKELNNIYKQIATKICKTNFAEVDIYMRIFPDRSFLR